MKAQGIPIILTIVNLALLAGLLAKGRPAAAGSGVPVLRGSALEIVDDRGKVRASIKIHLADPNYKMPDGRVGIPETVMLRLIDPNGSPKIKIGASVTGAGLGIGGESDATYIQAIADGADTTLRLTNKDGKQQLVKP